MYEVEVKVRAEHGQVRDRLRGLDAEHLGEVVQVDTYYDHPTRSFAETDEALRVRRERNPSDHADDDRAILTYKGPLVDDRSKTRAEVETWIGDGDAVGDILAAIDFETAVTVRKHRDRYALDGYTISIDRVDGLGPFVEVEAEADEDEIADRRNGALDMLSRLGVDPDEQLRTSYLELLAAE